MLCPIAICPEGGMKGGRVAEPFAAILAFAIIMC